MRKKNKINPKKDSIRTIRQKVITKLGLKNKRSYCKFYLECEYFYVESYTCTHKGSEYCGKYREFISNKSKSIDIKCGMVSIGRVPIPKEDYTPKFTKLDNVGDL